MNDICSEGFKIMYRKKAKLHSKLSLSKDSEKENIVTTKEPFFSSLVGDQTTQSPTTSTTCYALNLQDDTRIPNMRRNIPRT